MDDLMMEAAAYSAKMYNAISVGTEFFTETGKWRCTDKGTRVVVAIKLEHDDESWYNGPPYAVAETVFDEYDREAVALTREAYLEMFGED